MRKPGRWQPFQRRYLFHLLFWIMYAVFMILDLQGYSKHKGALFSITPLLIYFLLMAMLVYVNILVLIPLLLQKKKTLLYIAGVVVLMILYTFLRSANQQYWDAIVWPEDIMSVQFYYKWNFIYAVWFTIISSMLFFTQKWSEQQQKVKNIEINQLETELKYLRSQLNPHFLFNGLNTIYGNIDIRDQKARNTLLQFSDLLRYSLYEADVDFVDLEKETRHLENYVALQRARSNTNMQINLSIQVEDKTQQIAPLIFMPFVENAFKFSTRDDSRQNFISIRLEQSGNKITFNCSNSYEENESARGGIGLNNVKRRLQLLYKNKHTLNMHHDEEKYYVELIIEV